MCQTLRNSLTQIKEQNLDCTARSDHHIPGPKGDSKLGDGLHVITVCLLVFLCNFLKAVFETEAFMRHSRALSSRSHLHSSFVKPSKH